ncbi:hypothetical protein CDV36_015914 [Fusarium kuroshium]|uniref:Uncharacterized protein n=1 Tax=Fusarium kuroshium TaxID=2010991 RepID=A0A3M2R5H6_9HYPO|nr:hypothetical protein CDV36_015914 [Fusarium kuroshium]
MTAGGLDLCSMAVPAQARRYFASEDYEVKRSRRSGNLIQHHEDLTKNGAPPERRERTFHDTSLKVGVLDKDHSEPNTTRRRINQPEDDDLRVPAPFMTETSSIPPKSKHRKAGRPIYLGLTLNLEQEYYS